MPYRYGRQYSSNSGGEYSNYSSGEAGGDGGNLGSSSSGGSGRPASSSQAQAVYYNQPYATGSYYGSPGESSAGGGDARPHIIVERTNMTLIDTLRPYLMEMSREGITSHFCGWRGCQHPIGFAKQSQLVAHIRSVHLLEKPFVCATCNAMFDRRQDASRHVATLNRRQYQCSSCERLFRSKDDRDVHEESCLDA